MPDNPVDGTNFAEDETRTVDDGNLYILRRCLLPQRVRDHLRRCIGEYGNPADDAHDEAEQGGKNFPHGETSFAKVE